MTKRERDAAATREFLETVGWTGEWQHLAVGVDASAIDRFWCKVAIVDGHWLWTRGTTRDGKGQFGLYPGLSVRPHRLAWELMHGEIPEGHVLIRSSECPHPHCASPECYRVATKTEASRVGGATAGNGRLKRRPGEVKLSCSQRLVDTLVAMKERGIPLAQIHTLGLRAGLGPSAIQHILVGNAVGSR